MDELIFKLNEMFNKVTKEDINDNGVIKNEDLYSEVSSLCRVLLIGNNRSCNWNNINILEQNGFHVYVCEKDSFGCLTGCIKKDGKILVYV